MTFCNKATVCVCLTVGLEFTCGASEAAFQTTSNIQTARAVEIREAPITEQENDWLAEYESSGSEGDSTIPLRKASWAQLGLAVAVLLGSGAVTVLATSKRRS